MELISQYWPLLLVVLYFAYRQYSSYKVKRLLPLLKEEGAILVDVRSPEEYASGHAPDTINIPLNSLSTELKKFSRDKIIVVCCASGTRSAMARKLLQTNGFKKTYNAGPWKVLLN